MNTKTVWAKSPKFHLRAEAIFWAIRGCRPGRFLEVGAGTGALAHAFVEREFSGALYDIGEQTRADLRERFSNNRRIRVVDDIAEVPDGSLDYLFAFEVLEHIVDDLGALRSWCAKLRPGGRVVISVPAHQAAFGPTDVRVGHVRRYERAQLDSLLSDAGLKRDRLISYGYPLGNLGRIVGNWLDRGAAGGDSNDAVGRSIVSGVEQSRAVVSLATLLNRGTLAPFLWIQRLFYSTDFGDGYVASATLR